MREVTKKALAISSGIGIAVGTYGGFEATINHAENRSKDDQEMVYDSSEFAATARKIGQGALGSGLGILGGFGVYDILAGAGLASLRRREAQSEQDAVRNPS